MRTSSSSPRVALLAPLQGALNKTNKPRVKLSNVPEGPSPRRGLRIQPRVLTLGTAPPLRIALKGLQIEGVNSRINDYRSLAPSGQSTCLMVPRVETLG
jgi:hypothetical protein